MKLSYQFLIVSILVAIAVFMQLRKTEDIPSKFNLDKHLAAYDLAKEELLNKQLEYRAIWKEASTANRKALIVKSRKLLVDKIPENIFTYWYGTTWAFHGTTKTPRKGSIACGYFVTTTLQQSGFELPRVKMAQQAASIIIKSLCAPKSIKTYRSMPSLERYLRDKPEGLFILGLDKHVGYVLKNETGTFFIHSTVAQGRKVVKESLSEAKVVKRSKIKMIGDLTGNDATISAWLSGQFLGLKP